MFCFFCVIAFLGVSQQGRFKSTSQKLKKKCKKTFVFAVKKTAEKRKGHPSWDFLLFLFLSGAVVSLHLHDCMVPWWW
jgi:hypothetical protein